MNKKMLLSVLIIAFVGVAAVGTWANYVVTAESTGNTLTAGELGIELNRPLQRAFAVNGIIPDSKEQIEYKFLCFFEDEYFVNVRNTGNIPGQLFISSTETSAPQSLADNVKIYYSTNPSDPNPKEITGTPVDTGVVLNGGAFRPIYFWYSYKNVDSSIQNAEMGKTLNVNMKFELRNPETSESTIPGA
ncbi:hypothetical protein [Methanosarcina mazei]|uniref:DUF1102 domain-containing protein n=1 Tax=Methanosarcina mazei TaxID=2209 RepID=A0A0F8JDB7_METMZ|nr:hypothetical protein [Methanosarcina mazei]KKG66775.1 hypothetical protein DU67_02475 [Methanosarcina mazei]